MANIQRMKRDVQNYTMINMNFEPTLIVNSEMGEDGYRFHDHSREHFLENDKGYTYKLCNII